MKTTEYETIVNELKSLDAQQLIAEQDGEVLAAFPERPRRLPVHSVAKSIFALGLYFPVSEGILDLDETLGACFAQDIRNLPADRAQKDALGAVSLRHLLSMTMGQEHNFLTGEERPYLEDRDWVRQCLMVPVAYRPGKRFLYADMCMYLVGKLVQRRTGENLVCYLNPRFFEPMGLPYPTWEMDPQGDAIVCGGLLLSASELHRFGQLCLSGGLYRQKRIVPEAWIQTVTSPKILLNEAEGTGYGYGFWSAPGCCWMFGYGGNYCVIDREQRLVMTVLSGNISTQDAVLGTLMKLRGLLSGAGKW